MKKVNSCRKGKAAERSACHFLTKLGFPAERGARNGVKGCHDIVCPSLGRLLIECKSVNGMGVGTQVLSDAVARAIEDATTTRGTGSWTDPVIDKIGPSVVLWFEYRKGWRLTWRELGCELTAAWPSDIAATLRRLNGGQ